MATLAAEKAPPKPTAELEALYRQVEEWLSEPNGDDEGKWNVSYGVTRPNYYKRPGVEDRYGLILEAPDGAGGLHIEPLRTDYDGAKLVQIIALPTLTRVRLRRENNGSWRIETDSGVPFRRPWEKESFLTLIKDMLHVQ